MSVKLTDKQEMFCKEYMIDLNATQAAIRAGYSEKTANEIGCQNLAKLNIQEYISILKNKRSEKLEIKSDDVLKELKNWAFGDFTDVMQLSFEEIKELPIELRRLITGFEKVTTQGQYASEKIKVTFVDKKAAMDMIAKHMSFFAPEEKILKTEITEPVKISFTKK